MPTPNRVHFVARRCAVRGRGKQGVGVVGGWCAVRGRGKRCMASAAAAAATSTTTQQQHTKNGGATSISTASCCTVLAHIRIGVTLFNLLACRVWASAHIEERKSHNDLLSDMPCVGLCPVRSFAQIEKRNYHND